MLDYGGVAAALGKNVGDDFRERKMTLPVIRALEAAGAEERAFWARVIGKGEQRAGDLEQAMALMARHGALESAHRDRGAPRRARRARRWRRCRSGRCKAQLAALAEFVVARLA